MAVVSQPTGGADRLEAILHHAGAVFGHRAGRRIAVSYGSPAGELAVCVRAVGLVDRSELAKFILEAPPAQLSHLAMRMTGQTVAVGGALPADGAWWCRTTPERFVVLCSPLMADRFLARLPAHHVSLRTDDVSETHAALAVVGRAKPKVLAALGVYGESGDARRISPITTCRVGGVEVMWLLESDRTALAVVPRSDAADVWRAIEEAGKSFGLSYVGHEAASRYTLLERTASGSAHAI